MNIYCDRFSVCHSVVMERGDNTEMVARAKGWHLWRGQTIGGQYQEVILCDKCVEAGRRITRPRNTPLADQEPIPEL